MSETKSYKIQSRHLPDLIHRLAIRLAAGGEVVRIELETFSNGDVNVIVGGMNAATLKKEGS
jgi:hypothetical protein